MSLIGSQKFVFAKCKADFDNVRVTVEAGVHFEACVDASILPANLFSNKCKLHCFIRNCSASPLQRLVQNLTEQINARDARA